MQPCVKGLCKLLQVESPTKSNQKYVTPLTTIEPQSKARSYQRIRGGIVGMIEAPYWFCVILYNALNYKKKTIPVTSFMESMALGDQSGTFWSSWKLVLQSQEELLVGLSFVLFKRLPKLVWRGELSLLARWRKTLIVDLKHHKTNSFIHSKWNVRYTSSFGLQKWSLSMQGSTMTRLNTLKWTWSAWRTILLLRFSTLGTKQSITTYLNICAQRLWRGEIKM